MFDSGFEIGLIIIKLKKHFYLFISIVVLVFFLFVLYLARAPKFYTASVTVEIEPRDVNILGYQVQGFTQNSFDYFWSSREYFVTQYEIIKSRAVCEKVVENLAIRDNVNFFDAGVPSENKNTDQVQDIDPVKVLCDMVSVIPEKNSQIVRIRVTHSSPEMAALLSNAVADAYREFNFEKKYLSTKNAAKWLSEQSINLKKNLEDSELELFSFKKEKNILSTTFDSKQASLAEKISEIDKKITSKEFELQEIRSKLDQINNSKGADITALLSVLDNNRNRLIQELKLKYIGTVSELKTAQQFYGEKHPKLTALENRLKNIERNIQKETQEAVESINIENAKVQSELKRLKTMLLSVQQEAIALNKLEINYNKLKREVETNRRLYDLVLERNKEADLNALLKTNNIRIIDRAVVPKVPVSPRKKIVLLLGFLCSIAAGFGFILLYELFDSRLKTVEDLDSIIHSPVLGVLPTFEVKDDNMIKEIAFEIKSHSPAVESLRTIRTNLRLSNPDKEKTAFLVTSSIAKEGKTTVSSNIAVSFALSGKKVLIIDTDMRRPRLHKIFGMTNKSGITSYIMGEQTIDEIIVKNIYQGLDAVFCGPIPPNPSEMIESMKFRKMIDTFKSIYDIVIFDTPPLLAVSDALALSSITDGFVVVVQMKEISKDILKRSVRLIEKAGINIKGFVINNLDITKQTGYGSYYYYYHEKYYGEESKGKG